MQSLIIKKARDIKKNYNLTSNFKHCLLTLVVVFSQSYSFSTKANNNNLNTSKQVLPSIYSLLFDQNSTTKNLIRLEQRKAFPTAYGAGAATSGGRGGIICYVNRRDDPNSVNPNNNQQAGFGVVERINSGIHTGNYIGSFRGCMRLNLPRTVYFLVGGRFEIDRLISLSDTQHDDLTTAGETALTLGGLHVTGEYNGVTVNDAINRSLVKDIFIQNVDNILIRYLDRKGLWEYWRDWGNDGRVSALNMQGVSNVIVDHFSGGWGSYSALIGGVNEHTRIGGIATVQSSLMHEAVSGHNVANIFGFSGGGATLEEWGRFRSFSVHDTAYIGLTHRFPNISGYTNSEFHITNNYIDHWRSRSSYVGGSPNIDFTNNYFRKLTGPIYTSTNDGGFRTMLTLDPDSQDIPGNIQTPSIYARGNTIKTETGATFDNDTAGVRNWANMSGYWSNSGLKHIPLSRYERTTPLPATDFRFPLQTAVNAKNKILAEGRGASARIYPDGSTFIDSPIDKRYFEWANNSNAPTVDSVVRGDGGLGDSARFVHPYYPSRSISLDDLDADGVPLNWRLPEEVVNNAGYSRLELYLADIAGDYIRLGLIKPQINTGNATSTTNEASSIGTWERNSVQLTTINDEDFVYKGNSALKVTSNSGGYSNTTYSFTAEKGKQYQINFWAARSQGLTQGVYNWSGVKDFVVQQFDPNVPYINKQNSDKGVWQEFSQTVEAVDTTITLRLYATNPDQGNVNSGDDLYIDNVSITPR